MCTTPPYLQAPSEDVEIPQPSHFDIKHYRNMRAESKDSVCSDPLNPLRIGKENANGFGITPCNLSESISSLINYFCWLDPNAQPILRTLDCAIP